MTTGSRAVGLDVVPKVLELARAEIADAALTDRVELRPMSVADLARRGGIRPRLAAAALHPPPGLRGGLQKLFRAVRPDGWLVAPVMTPPEDADGFERAVRIHAAHLRGGGPVDPAEALLTGAGWIDVGLRPVGPQFVITGRKPTR